jgi:hypothetical protein
LTREFNAGRLRAIVCSGQAVVLLRLAVASKDGDWILREDQEALDHVLTVLEGHGARYRFGAPLDLRWLRGGWSSHLEFQSGGVRVLARMLGDPREEMLSSRSAHDLVDLAAKHPDLARDLVPDRPALSALTGGVEELREALDRERRAAMDEDDRRIRAYIAAATELERAWPAVRARPRPLPCGRRTRSS